MRSEFDFINYIKDKHKLHVVGDDCAVLPMNESTDQLLTADLLVEDIDFRLEWTTPENIGAKALAVSLSDIAAMGGEPSWGMLSLGVPERLWNNDFVERLIEGWHSVAARFGVELVGGDISRVNTEVAVDSIVGGSVPKGKALLRSGAMPGDLIYVSGKLGSAAAGLRLLETKTGLDDAGKQADLIEKQLKPQPQVELGKLLRLRGFASSCIDLSDGLSSDLRHICKASRSGALITASDIPITDAVLSAFPEDAMSFALDGGEDFELLFTVRPAKEGELDGLPVTRIGEMRPGGRIEIVGADRTASELAPGGFRHF